MSQKVYCIASFEAKETKQQELLELLQGLEPRTKREDAFVKDFKVCVYTDEIN